MRRLSVAYVGLLVLAPAVVFAQPNCKKGKPCGSSCIAANRTCRIGSSSPSPAPAPAPTPPAPQTLLSRPESIATAPATTPAAAAVDTLLPWVVSATGATYYASACAGASRVAANRLFFRSEDNLQRLGMRRASAQEEACTARQMQEHERRLTASAAPK